MEYEEIKRLEPDGDFYVHCGDSEGMEKDLKGWISVRGNNDWMAKLDDEIMFETEGLAFLVTHGHRYGYLNFPIPFHHHNQRKHLYNQ